MVTAWVWAMSFGLAVLCEAQTPGWSYRGFLENRTLFFPQKGVQDDTQLINETVLRFESVVRLPGGLRIASGIEAQTDTAGQVARALHVSWIDRDLLRPPLALKILKIQYARGPFLFEAGKQVLHWGVMDLFSPTDRFAPRDFLSPSGSDYLGVFAVRGVLDTGRNSFELIYLPVFTPSRIPLVNQRWFVPPIPGFNYRFEGADYPGGPQFGGRYHRVHSSVEYSLSYFDGFWDLPSASYQLNLFTGNIAYKAHYAKTRMVGADFTVPWHGFVWKAESSYITSPSSYSDDYWTYAGQMEKTHEKWQLTAGYTGEYTTEVRHTAAADIDRALRKSFTGRVAWTPTDRNLLSSEWLLRQNGRAFITRILYSRSLTSSFRATVGWIWIVGQADESIGKYRRNSYLTLQFRRSF